MNGGLGAFATTNRKGKFILQIIYDFKRYSFCLEITCRHLTLHPTVSAFYPRTFTIAILSNKTSDFFVIIIFFPEINK